MAVLARKRAGHEGSIMTVDSTPRLVSDELRELLRLAREADSIELKLTVPEQEYRSTAAALGVDPLEAQIRQVFFFDTPDLRLNEAGVVARARRIQGRESDSTVKLRPVVPDQLPKGVRESENFVVEVDAMPGGYVCSGSMKGKLAPTAVLASVSGDKPLRRLFSKEQRAFFAAHAPEGLGLDDLSVLGPIFVLKLKMKPDLFSRRLVRRDVDLSGWDRGSSSCRRSVCLAKPSTSPTRRARS